MLRASAVVLIAASAVLSGPGCRAGEAPVGGVEAPEVRGAPGPPVVDVASPADAGAEARIGEFQRPDGVPEYEIIDEGRNERDGARGAWLLVNTRSEGQEDYVLITRDVKAKYAPLDAVSIEFIDLTQALRYKGGAVVFNTGAGADYIGYVHGPPNADGYLVRAADD